MALMCSLKSPTSSLSAVKDRSGDRSTGAATCDDLEALAADLGRPDVDYPYKQKPKSRPNKIDRRLC